MTPFVKVNIDSARNDDLTDFVESVKFEDELKKTNTVEITVRPERALDLLNNKDIDEGVTLSIQYGFLGGATSLVRTVKLVDIETKYAGKVSLLLRGMDAGNAMKKTNSMRIWKNLTSTQIAAEIAATHGLKAIVDSTTKVWDNLPQAGKSDFELLTYLANREKDGKYRFYISDDSLYFVEEGLDTPSEMTYTYNNDDRIVSFSPKYRKHKAKSKDGSSTGLGVDDKTKAAVGLGTTNANKKDDTLLDRNEIEFTNDGLRKTGLRSVISDFNKKYVGDQLKDVDKQLAQDSKDGKAGANKVVPIPAAMESDEVSNMTNADTKKGGKKVLTATLVVVLNPNLKVNTVITIAGVADRHSGNWLVEKVTHTIGGGRDAMSTVELNKNAVKSGGTKKEKPADKEVNTTVGDKQPGQRKRVYYSNNGDPLGTNPNTGKGLSGLRNTLTNNQ